MFRHLFTALCALSLLLCVATVVLWVRSYSVTDWWQSWNPHGAIGLRSSRGVVRFYRAGFHVDDADIDAELSHTTSAPADFLWNHPSFLKRHGLGYESVATPQTRQWWVNAPLWLIAVLFAAMPLARPALLAWRRQRRRRKSLCLRCGYDLRASPGRCPECGSVSGSEVA